ncbi:MAG: hypothetical protein A2293_16085 [Elusimicrobia bacterium RIFOXYB2_FULL_49_7]|nr:MAG: hypothetical protein A2293_16085 [Elusimicrobia bacterium RIFOXYB2_FULL_49_7]
MTSKQYYGALKEILKFQCDKSALKISLDRFEIIDSDGYPREGQIQVRVGQIDKGIGVVLICETVSREVSSWMCRELNNIAFRQALNIEDSFRYIISYVLTQISIEQIIYKKKGVSSLFTNEYWKAPTPILAGKPTFPRTMYRLLETWRLFLDDPVDVIYYIGKNKNDFIPHSVLWGLVRGNEPTTLEHARRMMQVGAPWSEIERRTGYSRNGLIKQAKKFNKTFQKGKPGRRLGSRNAL